MDLSGITANPTGRRIFRSFDLKGRHHDSDRGSGNVWSRDTSYEPLCK